MKIKAKSEKKKHTKDEDLTVNDTSNKKKKKRLPLIYSQLSFPSSDRVQLLFTWNLSPLRSSEFSHLNICYYHQDLHQRPFHPGSRQRLHHDGRAILLVGTLHLYRRPGIGATLERHPFSGQVHSAGELLPRIPTSMATVHVHVPLVFRHYIQIRQSICTSESLRASTTVSAGFALFRHSSPSFGSQHVCSYSNLSITGRLAHMLDSLVCVSRRVE